jgi:hypothetical protein
VKAIELEGGAVASAIDPQLAAAGIVYISGRKHVRAMWDRSAALMSPALRNGSLLAVAKDGVTSVLGPVRVAAVRKEGTSDQVRLRFCMELAWAVRKPDALRWIEGA